MSSPKKEETKHKQKNLKKHIRKQKNIIRKKKPGKIRSKTITNTDQLRGGTKQKKKKKKLLEA